MKLPLNVVHVPKTAGTSLRAGLVRHVGQEQVLRDYGLASEDTSELIRLVGQKPVDLQRLQDELQKNPRVLIGHYPVGRYSPIFPANRITCFLREPVARMFSDFYHEIRHRSANTEFEKFVSARKMRNHMSGYLRGFSWPALGFVGISEQYEQSLQIFNEFFAANVSVHRENLAPFKHSILAMRTRKRRELIESLNQKDIGIYEAACRYFSLRLQAAEAGLEFVHGCFDVQKNQVSGYAFRWSQQASSEPLKLWIRQGNSVLRAVRAREHVSELENLTGIPRRGRVGFSIEVSGITDIDNLNVIEDLSRQNLPRIPARFRIG